MKPSKVCSSAPASAGRQLRRGGFSLLEVMLATAILASSALVLSSLLGLGAKFGGRAEVRTEALSQAQSLMDEFLVLPMAEDDPEQEITGALEGNALRSYRITVVPSSLVSQVDTANLSSSATLSDAKSDASPLVLVTVEILQTNPNAGDDGTDSLCRLSQLIRRERLIASNSAGSLSETLP